MVLIGRRLTATELQAVLDDAEAVSGLLFGDLDDEDAEMPEPHLDIDKSWHAIHYLLTGTEWEIGQGADEAILGGQELGVDNGYGPARLVTAEQVTAIAHGLDAIDIDELRSRFDPAAMVAADIYPAGWGEADFDSYIQPHYQELRRFYREAADHRAAVLLALT